MRAAMLLVLLGCGCTTGSANTMTGAAVMTGAALAASGIERASGGCYAVCTNGTACNPRNGLCEVLPCRGRCNADERCEETAFESKCVPGGGGTGVTAVARGKEAVKVPVAQPASSSAGSQSGPPAVVPAAEQNPPSNK